jgi:hypothetical protein
MPEILTAHLLRIVFDHKGRNSPIWSHMGVVADHKRPDVGWRSHNGGL